MRQNSTGIRNNESYCMGVKRECDRIYRAFATTEEDEAPEAERRLRAAIQRMEAKSSRRVKHIWPAKMFSLSSFW